MVQVPVDLGGAIMDLERDLDIPAETIARALDVDRRTVERWRANRSAPQGKTRERMAELVALHERLITVLGTTELAREWLRTRSLYLGEFTPMEALKAGRIDRVRADIDGLVAGVYL